MAALSQAARRLAAGLVDDAASVVQIMHFARKQICPRLANIRACPRPGPGAVIPRYGHALLREPRQRSY